MRKIDEMLTNIPLDDLMGEDIMDKRTTNDIIAKTLEKTGETQNRKPVKLRNRFSIGVVAAVLALTVVGGALATEFLKNNNTIEPAADIQASQSEFDDENNDSEINNGTEVTELYTENYNCLKEYYEQWDMNIDDFGDQLQVFDEQVGELTGYEGFNMRIAATIEGDPFCAYIFIAEKDDGSDFAEDEFNLFDANLDCTKNVICSGAYPMGKYMIGFISGCYAGDEFYGVPKLKDYIAGEIETITLKSEPVDDAVETAVFTAQIPLPEQTVCHERTFDEPLAVSWHYINYISDEYKAANPELDYWEADELYEFDVNSISLSSSCFKFDMVLHGDEQENFNNAFSPEVTHVYRQFTDEALAVNYPYYFEDENCFIIRVQMHDGTIVPVDFGTFSFVKDENSVYHMAYSNSTRPIDYSQVSAVYIADTQISIVSQ